MGNEEPVISRLCKRLQALPPQELLCLGLHGANIFSFYREISSGQILSISKYPEGSSVSVEFRISSEQPRWRCLFVAVRPEILDVSGYACAV